MDQLIYEVTMDQLIYASLSYTHYWYEVGMLKVPARKYLLRTVPYLTFHYERYMREYFKEKSERT